MPFPRRAIVSGEPGASLVIEILPLATVGDTGEKFALNAVVCPALIVNGVTNLLMLKPAPEVPVSEIVTLFVPELVSVIICGLLRPTGMLSKLTFAGFAASVVGGTTAAAMTVRVAVSLVMVPVELVTATSKCDPLSCVAAGGVV